MGREGLLVATVLTPLALALALSPLLPESTPHRRPAGAVSDRLKPGGGTPAAPPAAMPAGVNGGGDPNLPLVVGDSRRRAARAIDDTAVARHPEALVALGRRFRGTPPRSAPPGSEPPERLVLDLTAVDPLSFIEQLLALVNSREVRSRTEAVDRFSDHVRRLRYGGGAVDPCARLSDPRLWALAAERRGYLVDLTRFLPGAIQRRLPLQELTNHALAGSGTAVRVACRPPGAGAVTVAELPLEAVPAAVPSLRSGDLFILMPGPRARRGPLIGLVDLERGRLGAVVVHPDQGVVQEPDLLALARSRSGTRGIAFLRSLPNADGRPDP